MRVYIIFLLGILTCVACKQGPEVKEDKKDVAISEQQTQEVTYTSYGAKITADNSLTSKGVQETYAALKAGDTAIVKFEAPINAVCKSRGCWMRLDVAEEEVFVKFKDYGFFVPTDTEGEAIVEGKAYLEEVSVDELKHMAEDAGKTAEEIAAITTPQRELRFMADGVLIKGE